MTTEIIKDISKRSKMRLISEQEKIRIISNFIKAIEPFYEEKEKLQRLWNDKEQREYIISTITLPKTFISYNFLKNREWTPKTKEARIYSFLNEVKQRIYYRIRMYADDFYIGLLVQIYGLENAIQILRGFAKQNRLVADKIDNFIGGEESK